MNNMNTQTANVTTVNTQKKRGPKGPWKNLTQTKTFVRVNGVWTPRAKGRVRRGIETKSVEVPWNWNGEVPDSLM